MRRVLAVVATLFVVASLWVFIATRANGFLPVFAGQVARAFAVPLVVHDSGMNFIECWGCDITDATRGIQMGLLAILLAAFPAAIVGISLTTTPAYRGRSWDGRWRYIIRTGAVLQGGTIGLCVLLLALSLPETFTFGVETLLTALSLVGPSLVMSVLAMPSWLKLQTAIVPVEVPSVTRFAIR